MRRIDAHVHLNGGRDGAALLERLDMQAVSICVASANNKWREAEKPLFQGQARACPQRFAWITSFDLPDGDAPGDDYVQRVIAGLEADFADRAIGCKVWKNLGMELQDRRGRYLMVDDPLFEPIFDHLARTGRSLVMHIGEPKACWEPLQPGTPHYGYYSEHPKWHMHGRTDMPTHEALMAARDRLVERHPDLRCIGAHYGSLEYDVNEVARRFDRYPNFAVDTSARLGDMAFQDRQRVREFFIQYQDRILWGSDEIVNVNPAATAEQRRQGLADLEATYELEWQFFATDQDLVVQGRPCRGLGLPPAVLTKLFHDNACRWYPDLQETAVAAARADDSP